MLVDSAKVYKAIEIAIDNGEDFDSDIFERALKSSSYIVDDSTLFLDNRKALMAYAEKVSRKYLLQDSVTMKFHGTPKSCKDATSGEDKDT